MIGSQDPCRCVEATSITSGCDVEAVINVADGATLAIDSNYRLLLDRVSIAIQFTSQVLPPSSEKDCS